MRVPRRPSESRIRQSRIPRFTVSQHDVSECGVCEQTGYGVTVWRCHAIPRSRPRVVALPLVRLPLPTPSPRHHQAVRRVAPHWQ